MPPLPPPPPPAAPPPPPMSGPPMALGGLGGAKKSGKALDRNAMLTDIRSGTRLRKVTTMNDRSAPSIDGNKSPSSSLSPSSNSSNGGQASSGKSPNGANGGGGGPPALGGLFAQGMPKLRSTGNKLIPVRDGHTPSSTNPTNQVNNSSKGHNVSTSSSSSVTASNNRSAIKASLEQQFAVVGPKSVASNSSNNSSSGSVAENVRTKFNTINVSRSRNSGGSHFPGDMGAGSKGPAPSVPSSMGGSGQVPPNKTSGEHSVLRSNSHSKNSAGRPANSGNRPTPPAMKPPPPPKINGTSIAVGGHSHVANGFQASPPLPLKPPNVNRRQSFGGGDNVTVNGGLRSNASSFSEIPPPLPAAPPPPLPGHGGSSSQLKPPPPPRNNSVPNGLNNQPLSTPNHHHHPQQYHTMKPTRTVATVTPIQHHQQQHRSVHPGISPRPPLGPPPPPPQQHARSSSSSSTSFLQSSYPAPPPPPSQTRAQNSSSNGMSSVAGSGSNRNGAPGGTMMSGHFPPAPQPPTRHTSITRIDLDARFGGQFKEVLILPRPELFGNLDKKYPSQLIQSQCRRRDPPPPPPPTMSSQNTPHLAPHGMNGSSSSKKLPTSTPVLHNGQPQMFTGQNGFTARC